jgi:AcrR family transcriptional regulator
MVMARPKKTSITTETTTRLLAAAEAHFGAHGFAGTRLADVAADAGIRRPSLLYHFESKDQLYASVVSHAFTQLTAAFSAGLAAQGDYPHRLRAIVDELLTFEQRHPNLSQVILRALMAAPGAPRTRVVDGLKPLMDLMVAFVDTQGSSYRAPGISSRVAVTTLLFGHFMRSTLGDEAPTWFGDADATRALTEALLLRPESPQ